jgi:hypothetical protein
MPGLAEGDRAGSWHHERRLDVAIVPWLVPYGAGYEAGPETLGTEGSSPEAVCASLPGTDGSPKTERSATRRRSS